MRPLIRKVLAAAFAITLNLVPLTTAAQSAEAAIRDAYARLAIAIASDDTAALGAIFAPGYVQTDTNGQIESLSQLLADIAQARRQYPGFTVSPRIDAIRVHGTDADVDVTVTEAFSYNGHPGTQVERQRDRWNLKAGRWVLAATAVLEETDAIGGKTLQHLVAQPFLTSAQKSAILAQLKSAAWPLASVLPSDNVDDLAPLGKAIGNAQIVGMGEATHGTSEFFSLKDRIVRYLVTQMGFTVFAMEANWSDGLAIDRYVTTGQGDVRVALARTFAVWNNQETLDLLQWMRRYNAAPGQHPMLHFVGIDMQSPQDATKMVVAAFAAAKPTERAQVASDVACMDLPISAIYATYLKKPEAERKACARSTAAALALVAKDGAAAQTLHAATVVNQAAEMYANIEVDSGNTSRDASMAKNVAWVARTLYPNARIALWAHDGHIITAPFAGMHTMGMALRKAFGANYYAIGTAFDRGSISPNGVVPPIDVPQARPPSIEALWQESAMPAFGLDLDAVPPASPLGVYLSSPHPMRMVGAISSAAELSQTIWNVALSNAFDTLIFIEQSHAAHSFGVASRKPGARVLLTLPSGTAGTGGKNAWVLTGLSPQLYEAAADSTVQYGGIPSLRLSSSKAGENDWAATLRGVRLAPYQGKRLRVTGFLRTRGVVKAAGFWVRVDGHDGHVAAFDNMADRPLSGDTDWKPFSVVLDVPADARDIVMGSLLTGAGSVWVDGLSVSTVGPDVPTTSH